MKVGSDVAKVRDREDERGDSDEDRPERDEEVCRRGVDNGWTASYVFEDVEPVLEQRWPKKRMPRVRKRVGDTRVGRTKDHV